MQRRQRVESVQNAEVFGVQQQRLGVNRAAVNDAVADAWGGAFAAISSLMLAGAAPATTVAAE